MFRLLLISSTALVFAGSTSFAAGCHHAAQKRTALPKGIIAASSIDGIPAMLIFQSQKKKGSLDSEKSPPVANTGATFDNFSTDRNAEFLSWYGFSVSAYEYSSSSACARQSSYYSYTSGYTRIAIPIEGKGASVTSITIPVAVVRGGKFNVALYTSDEKNTPRKQIAAASGVANESSGYCCGQIVTVSIPPTKLKKGKPYWLVESGAAARQTNNQLGWLAEDTDYTGDAKVLWQSHEYKSVDGHVTINYTSKWTPLGPENVTGPAAEVE